MNPVSSEYSLTHILGLSDRPPLGEQKRTRMTFPITASWDRGHYSSVDTKILLHENSLSLNHGKVCLSLNGILYASLPSDKLFPLIC